MKKYLLPVFAAGALFSAQAALADGEAIFKSKPCVACHAMETKMVGPALKEVAEKYENNEENVALIAGRIKNGVSGVWGQIPMPANQVTEEEATTLAEWILSLND
jgi:cytochrome c